MNGFGGFWIALALMLIFTGGEPDLVDALVYHLMGVTR